MSWAEREKRPTPMEVQEQFYEEMGDGNWTRFTINDYVYLKHKIGYALFGPPSTVGDMYQSGAVTARNDIQGYDTRQVDSINDIYRKITSYAQYNKEKEIFLSIVFVVCMRPQITEWHQNIYIEDNLWEFLETKTDVVMWTVPVFAIRRCHPILYKIGKDFFVRQSEFKVMESPAMTVKSKMLRGADIGGTVAAVGAATAGIVLTGPLVAAGALAVGSVVGVYGIVRSSLSLKNRSEHRQSIDPFTDPEARSCWLNLGVSFVGVGAGAATAALKSVAKAGSGATQVGKALKITVDTFRYANLGFSSVGVLNGIGYGIYKWTKHKEPPTALECFQLATSVLFFANSVISNKTAAEIVTETEMQTISNFRESLRSNRHRIFGDIDGA